MTRFLVSFGAWASGLSGGDRHLLESAARWKEEVELELLAPKHAHETIAEYVGDVPFTSIGSSARPVRTSGPVLAGEYVRRAAIVEVRTPPADVVVGGSHFLPDAAAVHGAARRGAHPVAFVYHLVTGREDRSLRTRWSRADERVGLMLLARARATLFTSNTETADALHTRGLETIHTDVGLKVGRFARAHPASSLTVVFVARLVAKKGLEDLVVAWQRVVERVPDAQLVVAGSGPERKRCEALAARLGVDEAIDFRGFVSEDEKRSLLSKARLFAAPSYEEGWGIAVAEAMASGLPVVAYALPTLDEVFGRAYCSVPLGDTESLAREIADLLLDRKRAERIGSEGVQAVAPYDLDVIAAAELRAILDARARR